MIRDHLDYFDHLFAQKPEVLTTSEDRQCLWYWAGIIAAGILIGLAFAGPSMAETRMIPHPAGCPRVAFCGCAASVRVFGQPVRNLYLARNWFKFPRSSPGHMKVAARSGHVFVIDYMRDATTAMAWDYNSGGHRSRYHARSIAGYRIVDPRSSHVASAQTVEKQP